MNRTNMKPEHVPRRPSRDEAQTTRAANELTAACNVLQRAAALFNAIKFAVSQEKLDEFYVLSLIELGAEMTTQYAGRADNASDYSLSAGHATEAGHE